VEAHGAVDVQRRRVQGDEALGEPLGAHARTGVAQGGGDGGEEFAGVDGLVEIGVRAPAQSFGVVVGADGGGGDLDDGHMGRARIVLEALADLEAAHVGQPDIDDREVRERVLGGVQSGEPRRTGAGTDDRVAGAPEPAGEDVAVRLVVVDDEDGRG
jgi:hypothetical protein